MEKPFSTELMDRPHKTQRRHHAPKQTIPILRRHFLENEQPRSCLIKWDFSNNFRLNNAIGYLRSKDMLTGRQQEIQAERIGSC